jgi:cell division protein FtsB
MATTEIRLVRSRKLRVASTPLAISVLVALVVAMSVFPVRSYINQRRLIAQKEIEFAQFEDINESLQDQVAYLKTEAGLQDAIRNQLGYLRFNERRLPMMDMPALSTALPERWPYTIVSTMLLVRSLESAKKAAQGEISLQPFTP